MEVNKDLNELLKKINEKRKKLDKFVLKGLEKDGLLELSCELDELINEYYCLVLDKKK